MKTTMDRFGRVVIPKDIRGRLGLRSGTKIEINVQENEVVLKPVEQELSAVVKDGILVYSGTAIGDLRSRGRANLSPAACCGRIHCR